MKEEEYREKKRLSQIKSERRKIVLKRLSEPVKSFGAGLGKIADNVTLNREIQQSGVRVGDRVRITNGELSGESFTIQSFVLGGIEGNLKGTKVRIRHGSYKRI